MLPCAFSLSQIDTRVSPVHWQNGAACMIVWYALSEKG